MIHLIHLPKPMQMSRMMLLQSGVNQAKEVAEARQQPGAAEGTKAKQEGTHRATKSPRRAGKTRMLVLMEHKFPKAVVNRKRRRAEMSSTTS